MLEGPAPLLTAALPAVPTAGTPSAPKDAAHKAAQDFEAVFLGQLSKLMFENVDQGEFSGGHGEEMFRGLLAERIGDEMARRGGVGLAPFVLNEILRLQGQEQ